jgi:hypothetical protein
MQRQSLAIHLSLCLLLIFLFGGQIHSLSVDLPHHFAVVDELMKNGAANIRSAPNVGVMWIYPRLSHWLAAGLGHIVGSGLVAMWLVCIVAIYGGFVALCWLVGHGGRLLSLLIFFALSAAAVRTYGAFGFEVVGNFFYSQLVAFALYLLVLVALCRPGLNHPAVQIGLVLASAAAILGVHALPAIHLLAAFGLFLVARIALELWKARAVPWGAVLGLFAFAAAGLAVLRFHPAMANMRELSQNDGALEFEISNPAFLVVAGVAFVALALRTGKNWLAARPFEVDLVVLSALVASVALVVLQWLMLKVLGDGSLYAVKKHFFLLLTFSLLALARAAPTPPPFLSNWSGSHALRALVGVPLVAAGLTALTLQRPGIPLYPIVRAIGHAEHAVRFAFPAFQPGNTAALAETIQPVIRYMISVSTFQMPLADPRPVSLIDSSFVAERDARFVMVNRATVALKACVERYADADIYVIVPSTCLSAPARLPDGGTISFVTGSGAAAYLTEGWWPVEPWGVWSKGTAATVALELPDRLRNQPLDVLVTANAFVTPSKPTFTVDVTVNDRPAETWSFPASRRPFVISLPPDVSANGTLKIVFTPRDASSPAALGHNVDARVLGVALTSLEVRQR